MHIETKRVSKEKLAEVGMPSTPGLYGHIQLPPWSLFSANIL
jgi:hypothetical protein